MGKITILYANGEEAMATASSLSLEKLQQMVGGWIERVPNFTHYNGEKCAAYCDEEGKLKRKPVNEAATKAWYENEPRMIGHDRLVGEVVIVQGTDLLGKL